MLRLLAQTVEILTTLLTVAGMGYFVAAIVAARKFLAARGEILTPFTPGVSILKSLKGLDPRMIDGFRSHCLQSYAGGVELLFGVSTLADPAVTAVTQLQAEFPQHAIQLIECPQRLGSNGKVSTLVQLAEHARYEFLLVNDSDITVSPHYLEQVMTSFAPTMKDKGKPVESLTASPVGLVTALYRGRAHGGLFSHFEALGIATDFQAGVLLSKMIEGGLHYGLGSTLAVSRTALERIGGFLSLADCLADDYELGARVAGAGFQVALCAEVVETSIPAYDWHSFVEHQLRWLRAVRDARPWGYAGLIFTHGLSWAVLNTVISGFSLFSLWLLGLSLSLRFALAMIVGAGVLADYQVLPDIWLLPLRDLTAFGLWVAGFAGNTIGWRGERYLLDNGKLRKVEPEPNVNR
jgi:ceramide glucosyltransferase